MYQEIKGRRVAILVTDGFEQSELTEPRKALEQAGAHTVLVSPRPDEVRGWKEQDWGDFFEVDMALEDASADEFDALLLPGGVINPDNLRTNPLALEFIQAFVELGRPIAAICHGPITLVEIDAVKDRRITSYKSIKTDLQNAGAVWVDEPVVRDQGLVTSRTPKDLPQFIDAIKEEFGKGIPRTAEQDFEEQEELAKPM